MIGQGTLERASWKARALRSLEDYNRKTAVERLNGRLKAFYKLNDVRVRTLLRVRLHSLMSNMVLLASAVAFPEDPRAACWG